MNIKLVVSEVDGIITDGTQPVDELGITVFKSFYTGDFEAINEIKKTCPFVFLSSDNYISYNLMRKKNIPFYFARKDKRSKLLEIMRRYNVTADETLYIGSKLSDIPCMNMVPTSVCTNDLLGFKYVSEMPGMGVITEVYLEYFRK